MSWRSVLARLGFRRPSSGEVAPASAEPVPAPSQIARLVRRPWAEQCRFSEENPWDCERFELPPLVCPRDEFEDALQRHRRVVEQQLSALEFLTRRHWVVRPTLKHVWFVAGWIDAEPGAAPNAVVQWQREVGVRYAGYVSIWSSMVRMKADTMPVVVDDGDLVSCWVLGVETVPAARRGSTRRLQLLDEPPVFEPVRQRIERDAARHVRSWRATSTSPVRHESFEMQPTASTPAEFFDRLFEAARGDLLRQCARYEGTGLLGPQLLLSLSVDLYRGVQHHWLSLTREHRVDDLRGFPECFAVLDRTRLVVWRPVLMEAGGYGGLRWFTYPGSVADLSTRPPDVTEKREGAARRPDAASALEAPSRKRP